MQIDFYILEDVSASQSLHFACQLVEKLYSQQKHIYLHTNSLAEAERLDALLWTYKDNSFIPHNIYQAGEINPPAIQIGHGESPTLTYDVLINFCHEIPSFQRNFTHTIEIVFADPHVQQLARERFKQYREQGDTINTHKLKAFELNQFA